MNDYPHDAERAARVLAVDFTDFVSDLHAQTVTTITTRRDGNRLAFEATLAGEDFLDGPWSRTVTGGARNHRQATRRALRALQRKGTDR